MEIGTENLREILREILGELGLTETSLKKILEEKLREELTSGDPNVKKTLTQLLLNVILKDSGGVELSSYIKNLDTKLSEHRDALKPSRATPTQDLSAQSISAGGVAEITKTGLDGWSAIVVTVKATYDASATAGVRVRWLYSPDGANFDSPEDAEDAGNYEDLTFEAGKTRQRTILIPIFQPHVKIQIVNLDASYAVTVDAWTTQLR